MTIPLTGPNSVPRPMSTRPPAQVAAPQRRPARRPGPVGGTRDVTVRGVLPPQRGRQGADKHTHHNPSHCRRRTRQDSDRSQHETGGGRHAVGNSSEHAGLHDHEPAMGVRSG